MTDLFVSTELIKRTGIYLRPYQNEAVEAVEREFLTNNSTLLVMATGLGKTATFGEMIRRMSTNGKRCLVIAHRSELVEQAARHIQTRVGINASVEMAERRATTGGYSDPVVVASVQTCVAERGGAKRMERFNPSQFSLVVVDEAHHATSSSYRDVINYFTAGGAKVLGVTATPDRADEEALGQVFDSVAYEYGVAEGIADGYLVPIKQTMVTVSSLDYSDCRTTAGDLNGADLDRVLKYEETLHRMVEPTVKIAGERRTLVFCASVEHAERVAEIINRYKPNTAAFVSANTPQDRRRTIFRDFGDGKYQFLCNVGIATEGWDDPATDNKGVQFIAMMRPTKSRSLYCQMVGRGTRTLATVIDGLETPEARKAAIAASAKKCVTVLDFVGNCGRHKLMRVADALGGTWSDAVRDRATAKSEQDANNSLLVEVDVLEQMDEVERDLKREAEQKRRTFIKVSTTYKTQDINPFSSLGIVPQRIPGWAKRIPASEKQLTFLKRNNVPNVDNLNTKEASQLIDHIMSSPSDKQAWVLRKAGLDPAQFDRKGASEAIDKIKKGEQVA